MPLKCTTVTSSRYVLAYMGFFCTMVIYFCRINLSIAIVKMAGSSNSKNVTDATICPVSADEPLDDENSDENDSDFDWSQGQRGDLLGCYYYGYVLTQVLGAWLSNRIGFKIVLGTTTFVASILTLCTPILAEAGYVWIYAARIVIGLCHGVSFPLLHGAWSVWAPPAERFKLVSIYVTGSSVGTCLIFPIGGLLAGTAGGWQSVFYFTGASGLLWCVLWYFLVFDSPAQHPRYIYYLFLSAALNAVEGTVTIEQ